MLNTLDSLVTEFINSYQELKTPGVPAQDKWSASQIMTHVTFWHESFARNVHDLVNDRKPTPLKGKYSDLTRICFETLGVLDEGVVLERLLIAQETIKGDILDERLDMIPYKVGSRDYSPEEHLDIVAKHIQSHLNDLKDR